MNFALQRLIRQELNNVLGRGTRTFWRQIVPGKAPVLANPSNHDSALLFSLIFLTRPRHGGARRFATEAHLTTACNCQGFSSSNCAKRTGSDTGSLQLKFSQT